MSFYRSFFLVLITLFFTSTVLADGSIRADSHGPVGVMGEHMHKEGEWMFSYRYMQMEMDGNLEGSNSLSIDEVL